MDHAKHYVAATNRGYLEELRDRAAREEHELPLVLEKKVADADFRKNILSSLKS